MNDTIDHIRVWQGILYEGHYVTNIYQATVWPSALYEGHYMANVDQATV